MADASNPCKYERIDLIGYDDFFDSYLSKNRLCVFSSEVTKTWKSREEWVTSRGQPNFGFLAEHFGEATVPVADCGHEHFNSHCKNNMKLNDFIEYWQKKGSPNSNDLRCLYLKDWHFCKAFPEYKAYETPIYFTSDWLNEFWDQRADVSDDYWFVYMGPKGSWTPFHADVFCSYSWSANICGRKKWVIFPPGQERFLRDRLGNLPYDITSGEVNDQARYPEFSKASEPIVIIQEEGEVMFMPSGWHHQVVNLEDTISINHNWINGCGIERMWNHMKSELKKVQLSIEDCKDMDGWDEHCQVILKASSGMNYAEFLRFLCTVATPRIECLLGKMSKKEQSILQDDSSKVTNTLDGREAQASNSPVADKAAVFTATEECKKHLPKCFMKSGTHETKESPPRSFMEWIRTSIDIEDRQQHSFVDYCRFDLRRISERFCELMEDKSFSGLVDQTLEVQLKQMYHQIQEVLSDKVFGTVEGFQNV